MLKYLILLNFITLSFQIDNCIEAYPICKGCISGYTLIDPGEMWSRKCQKSDTVYLGDDNDPCYIYSDSNKNYCQYCKKGYIMVYTDKIECKQAPEHCQELENGKCTKCRQYFKLTDDNKCERTSCYKYEEGKCICDDGFYLVEEKECKKIPIQYCAEWDGKKCTVCYEGTQSDGNGGCKLIQENEDDDDEEKINIPHCTSLDSMDKTKCSYCEENYGLNEDQTGCIYLCTNQEDYCEECKDNYETFDGKTCEIIDPSYEESYAKLFNFNLIAFAMILFFIF